MIEGELVMFWLYFSLWVITGFFSSWIMASDFYNRGWEIKVTDLLMFLIIMPLFGPLSLVGSIVATYGDKVIVKKR